MKKSVLRNLVLGLFVFGILMGMVFPFYADLFVNYKPGMRNYFVAGCLGAGVVLGLMNYWLVHFFLLRNLKKLTTFMKRLGAGDLTLHFDLESHDTFGELIESGNEMKRELSYLVSEIKRSAFLVHQQMAQIGSLTREMERVIQEQSQQTHAMSEDLSHFFSTSQEVLKLVRRNSEMTESANGQAELVQQTASHSISVMEHLAQKFKKLTLGVDRLGEITRLVEDSVESINDISLQTKLLSFNASVEASRAGSAGAGFSVVAEEIGKLAHHSQNSTGSISSSIKELLEGSKQIHLGVAETSSAMGEMSQQISEARGKIEDIINQMMHVKERSFEVDHGVTEQVEQSQRTSHLVDQIATGSQSTYKKVQNLSNEFQRLEKEFDQLESYVGKFKLVA
ncbi:MAG: methyl-accepting chemotaxis protein [Bdellovibrionales bacterium]|nr:methyl-accepting chemotaxis protein [Bdellovibrionales bacterium]